MRMCMHTCVSREGDCLEIAQVQSRKHVCMRMCMRMCMRVCMHVCMRARVCVCTHEYLCVEKDVARVHVRMHQVVYEKHLEIEVLPSAHLSVGWGCSVGCRCRGPPLGSPKCRVGVQCRL